MNKKQEKILRILKKETNERGSNIDLTTRLSFLSSGLQQYTRYNEVDLPEEEQFEVMKELFEWCLSKSE